MTFDDVRKIALTWPEVEDGTTPSIDHAVLVPAFAGRSPGVRRDDYGYLTTPEVNPAFRRGGLMSFLRKQCASFPAYPGRA
jgi:hypothetical protein